MCFGAFGLDMHNSGEIQYSLKSGSYFNQWPLMNKLKALKSPF